MTKKKTIGFTKSIDIAAEQFAEAVFNSLGKKKKDRKKQAGFFKL